MPSLVGAGSAVWGLLALIQLGLLTRLRLPACPGLVLICLLVPAAVTLLSEQLEEQLVPSRRARWSLPATGAARQWRFLGLGVV